MQATREPRASTRCGSAPSIGFGLALLPLTVPAHHSFAPFDQTRLIDLSGVVVDFMLRSPHSILVIEAENNDGFAGLWEVEMGPNPIMRRQDFDADTFEPGDRIVVRGALRRDGVPGFLLGRGYFTADGAQIGRSNPLPVGEYEGPSGVDAADRFSGVWIVLRDPNINTFGDSPLPRTEWAARHRESSDIKESPAVHCVPPNLPALFYPPYLYGVKLEDDQVVFHYEYFAINLRYLWGASRPGLSLRDSSVTQRHAWMTGASSSRPISSLRRPPGSHRYSVPTAEADMCRRAPGKV